MMIMMMNLDFMVHFVPNFETQATYKIIYVFKNYLTITYNTPLIHNSFTFINSPATNRYGWPK